MCSNQLRFGSRFLVHAVATVVNEHCMFELKKDSKL